MRCDLHVHTVHSGMCTIPVARHFCRECYNQPRDLYETLKRRGMHLVTVTDHDSIDTVEALRSRPDFFVSEEVTCRMPSGTEIHVGVYDITDRQHVELQRRRDDLPSLLAFLREQDLFFSINHLFSSLTGRRHLSDFEWFENHFPAFEVRNGAMLQRANRNAAHLGRWLGKSPIGGSDAHTLRNAGCVYTEVPGARDREEFLLGLRRGRGIVSGVSGNYIKLTIEVLQICINMMRERPWTAVLAPVVLGVPAVTLVHYWLEADFASRWLRRVATARANEIGNPVEWILQAESEVSA